MNASSILSLVPNGLAVLLVALLVMGVLVFYALYHMGEVRAEFSHGSTMFKLEARDRRAKKKKGAQ